jgi:hypothetical protein
MLFLAVRIYSPPTPARRWLASPHLLSGLVRWPSPAGQHLDHFQNAPEHISVRYCLPDECRVRRAVAPAVRRSSPFDDGRNLHTSKISRPWKRQALLDVAQTVGDKTGADEDTPHT